MDLFGQSADPGYTAGVQVAYTLRHLPQEHAVSACTLLTILLNGLRAAASAPSSADRDMTHSTLADAIDSIDQVKGASVATLSLQPELPTAPALTASKLDASLSTKTPMSETSDCSRHLIMDHSVSLAQHSVCWAFEAQSPDTQQHSVCFAAEAQSPHEAVIKGTGNSLLPETEVDSSSLAPCDIAAPSCSSNHAPLQPSVEERSLIWNLSHAKTWQERCFAAKGLRSLLEQQAGVGPTDVLKALLEALKDGTEEVQSAASDALICTGGLVVDKLVDLMSGKHVDARYHAARALGQIGGPAVRAVSKLLVHKDDDVRYRATQALGQMRGNAVAAIDELYTVFKSDHDGDVRFKAAEALSQVGTKAVTRLSQALDEESREVRYLACWALGQVGASAIPALQQGLYHQKYDVRCRSAKALGEMGRIAAPASEDLRRCLDGGDELCSTASEALVKIGARAVPSVTPGLQHQQLIMRKGTVGTLGKIGKSARPALEEALLHEDKMVSSHAAWSLGEVPHTTPRHSIMNMSRPILKKWAGWKVSPTGAES